MVLTLSRNIKMAKHTNKKKKSAADLGAINDPKDAPIIYAYIYEREPSDLEKLYKSHHNSEVKKETELISGFEIIDNELVAKKAGKQK
jgi:hypothetical protein